MSWSDFLEVAKVMLLILIWRRLVDVNENLEVRVELGNVARKLDEEAKAKMQLRCPHCLSFISTDGLATHVLNCKARPDFG